MALTIGESGRVISQYISSLSVQETEEDLLKRKKALEDVEILLRKWVEAEVLKQNCGHSSCGSSIRAFGSQHFNVVFKGGDIDAVVLVPRFITRDLFFREFCQILQNYDHVTNFRIITGARVPIVSFSFATYSFDLCLVIYPLDVLPEDTDFDNYDDLAKMDKASLYSFNGIRETSAILQLVPDIEKFRELLRIVKYWAKSRCLYSTSMGLLGGIAWTILTAFICQKYPNAEIGALLQKFFKVLQTWPWPQAILLKELEIDRHGLSPWTPKQALGGGTAQKHYQPQHMPIITPSYPEKNCAFTAISCTKILLKEQLAKGEQTLQSIITGQSTVNSLFEEFQLLKSYKHYLMVTATSQDANRLNWFGLVEAKLRLFVQSLFECKSIEIIHPHVQRYETPTRSAGTLQCHWFLGLRFHAGPVSLNITESVETFKSDLKQFAMDESRGFWSEDMTLSVEHLKRSAVREFVESTVT